MAEATSVMTRAQETAGEPSGFDHGRRIRLNARAAWCRRRRGGPECFERPRVGLYRPLSTCNIIEIWLGERAEGYRDRWGPNITVIRWQPRNGP